MCNKNISLLKDCEQIGKDCVKLCKDTCIVVTNLCEDAYNSVKSWCESEE